MNDGYPTVAGGTASSVAAVAAVAGVAITPTITGSSTTTTNSAMSSGSSSSSSSSSKWSPPLRTIEEITQLLKPSDHGSRLDELKLCWREPKAKYNNDVGTGNYNSNSTSVLSKRNIIAFEKALKKTSSKIKHLSIGWKHGGNRKLLIQLIQIFISNASISALTTIESIELTLFTWIPDTILLQLLLAYGKQIKSLHIQATRIKVRTPKNTNTNYKNLYQVNATEYILVEESVAKIFSYPQLDHQSHESQQLKIQPLQSQQTQTSTQSQSQQQQSYQNNHNHIEDEIIYFRHLTSLSLIDCDVLDDEIDIILRFLWSHLGRTGGKPIETLSLRSNRHISPISLQKICQAPVSKRLDLSLCDIKNSGGIAIANAFSTKRITVCNKNKNRQLLLQHHHDGSNSTGNGNGYSWRQQNNVILKEFLMLGNYQLDHKALGPLARVIPHQVQKWNMSYCELNESQTMAILQEIKHETAEVADNTTKTAKASCPLQELILQGAKINNPEACYVIRAILQVNRSLVKINLRDVKYPVPMSIDNLKIIVDGLKSNYGIEELDLDLHTMRRQKQLLYSTKSGSDNSKWDEAREVRNDLDFYLLLNRAGRRILQNDHDQFDKEALIQALLKARLAKRMDVFYWLVRNSVVHMF